MLGLTSDENVKKRIDDGYPLIWTIPEEGTGYDGTFAFILKGTKNLDACKKVIDVLGTPEFSQIMAGIGYVTPRPAANALYGTSLPKYINLDLGVAAEDRPKNNDIWKQKFRTDFK
jgi:ABC-type Fe3+ transport system substrate-binding protein